MPPTEGASGRRVRTPVLVLACAAVALLVVYMLWPAAVPAPAPSNQGREQQKAGGQRGVGSFDVRLDALKAAPPEPAAAERNPFRFQPKAPPPPPPRPGPSTGQGAQQGQRGQFPPPVAPMPPPIPPIPLKCIGTLDKPGTPDKPGSKFAILVASDGRSMPTAVREGETVFGQYKLIKIGVESVVLEYLDGRGRQTIPIRGQQ